jgi:SpoVK/Ycf46/Vps4 family AAA+-type ATPase
LNASLIPANLAELETLIAILTRESMLTGLTLLVECFDLDGNDQAKQHSLRLFLERYQAPVLIGTLDRQRLPDRASVNLEVQKPTTLEQRELWQRALPEVPQAALEHLVAQFNLAPQGIERAAENARLEPDAAQPGQLERAIWRATRSAARPRMDDLAQRLEARATWDDLVLPASQKDILRDVTAHVRHRLQVYETWGFAAKSTRGLGISALFAGSSGTGKTMAAEVIGRELELDVYRIDLSTVVSKYIGETEKNLRRIFDAAEEGGTVLLFDEADAIFGKRSEVKDSHDRYANIEVAYLLQRMESYRGLAILTTNLKSSIDTAFLRRIRFITHFPFPDLDQRSEMWRRAFPQETPTSGLEYQKLGQLTVAGGNIRNMALNAAFIAADANEPVMMKHILHAAESEYAKLEKQLTASETKDWLEEGIR